jgi:hypothetical protein
MVAAIRRVVKVQPGGLVQVRSPRLKVGSEAEVIVLLPTTTKRKKAYAPNKSNEAAAKRQREIPLARMTKQVRGDLAEAHRIRGAIREGREKLIPWEQVKRDLGLE